MTNSPKWPAAYFAANTCGLTVIHGDVQFTRDEFRNIERFTNPALILCERSFSHFFRKGTQKIYLEDEKPEKKNPQVLENISETKLLLMEADSSFLILRRSRESMDLLGGNEKINRKKYNRW